VSAPLKVGSYLPKWAPDQSAAFQYTLQYGQQLFTHDKRCVHVDTGAISGQDTRSSDLQNWGGTYCCDCGRVMKFGEIDPVTGEARA
jgi:hypothetical protein